MARGRVLAFLPLFLLGGALIAAREAAPQRWVVIVGINDYVNMGPDDGDLQGAEYDALSMRDVLRDRWGIPEENMRVLLSLDATRAAIEEAFTTWLPARVQPDDQVIFYYSGHGGQAMDDDGDEEDGLDETICPTDVLANSFQNDIRDDEIRVWIEGLPTENVLVIFDSCHSGTGTRAVVESMRPRFLDRGLVDRPAVATRALGDAGEAAPAGPGEGMADLSTGLIELAAAAPEQTAMEGLFGRPQPGGAFTMHLVRQLWQAPPTATYEQLFRRVATGMQTDLFTQDPQFHGEGATRVLGGTATTSGAPADVPGPAPSDEVRITRLDGSRVVLSGGSARGITEGSVYETAGGALLRVAAVGPSTAEAVPVRGRPEVGEAARLLEVSLPDRELAVGVQLLGPDLRARLADVLGSGVRWVEDPAEEADLYLSDADDGLWVEVLGRDGGARDRIPGVRGMDAVVESLAALLRKELAVKRLAALENPAAPFDVELSIAGDRREFAIGDEIFFEVTSERAGYLTLVDLGIDGTVTVLYPNEWENLGRLEPGRTVRVPEGTAVFDLVPPAGSGLVRAIVTPEPLGIVYTDDGYATSDDGAALTAQIRDLVERGTGSAAGGARAWATTAVVYEVVPRAPR